MDERGYYVNRTGLTAAILGILLAYLVDEIPTWVAIPLVTSAVVLLVRDLIHSGYLVGILPTGAARFLLRQPSVSTRRRHGITLTVRLRWHDDVGRPIVMVDNDRVRAIWASLDIDVRNHHRDPQRVSELFLEIRTAGFLKRLIGTAGPAAIDGDLKWYERRFPRRVEWLLEPISPAVTHHVRFNSDWEQDDPSAPRDPKRFTATVIAELGSPDRQVRVELGDDIIG